MKTGRELELEVDLELSLLQIGQLQEELEHYLFECGRLKEQGAEYLSASAQTPVRALLAEGRVNDSRYFESGFYAKGEYLPSRISRLEEQLSDTGAEREIEKKRAEILQCQVEQLTVSLKESSSSAALRQKLLSKARLDLDHLRDAYAEKVASEQELVELANELRKKLTLASRYYCDLQKEHPELLLPIENT